MYNSSRVLAGETVEVFFDTGYDRDEIVVAIRRALNTDAFRARCGAYENTYGGGDSGKKIADALGSIEPGPRLI